jgi:hypothetical protein
VRVAPPRPRFRPRVQRSRTKRLDHDAAASRETGRRPLGSPHVGPFVHGAARYPATSAEGQHRSRPKKATPHPGGVIDFVASNPGSTAGDVARARGSIGTWSRRVWPSWPSRESLRRPSAATRRPTLRSWSNASLGSARSIIAGSDSAGSPHLLAAQPGASPASGSNGRPCAWQADEYQPIGQSIPVNEPKRGVRSGAGVLGIRLVRRGSVHQFVHREVGRRAPRERLACCCFAKARAAASERLALASRQRRSKLGRAAAPPQQRDTRSEQRENHA